MTLSIVGAGLMINGYLALTARAVTPAEYLHFTAFWSLSLVVGFGVFLPIEQEFARTIQRSGCSPALTRVALAVAGTLALVEILAALLAWPLLDRIFDHSPAISVALLGLCAISALQFVVRGELIGRNRLGTYALVLLADSASRCALALVLLIAGATSIGLFCWVIVFSIGLAHVPPLVGVLKPANAPVSIPAASRMTATSTPYRSMARGVLILVVGSLAAQALLNGLPIVVAGLAQESDRVAAGQLQAAMLLVRLPLFVAVPLQTTILPSLTRLFQNASPREIISAVGKLLAMVAGLAVAGAALALTIGPWLVRLVFGTQYRVGAVGLALLAVGVAGYLGALITTQALVVAARHLDVASGWVAGLVACAIVFFAVPSLVPAAEAAFLVGSLTAFLTSAGLLTWRLRGHGLRLEANFE